MPKLIPYRHEIAVSRTGGRGECRFPVRKTDFGSKHPFCSFICCARAEKVGIDQSRLPSRKREAMQPTPQVLLRAAWIAGSRLTGASGGRSAGDDRCAAPDRGRESCTVLIKHPLLSRSASP